MGKTKNKMKILVMAGGVSEEREVSLDSARAVTDSLIRMGYDVSVIDSATGKSLLDSNGKYLLEKDHDAGSKIALKQADTLALTKSLKSIDYKDTDLVFIALHGGQGEDGTVQAILHLAGIKYTGSGMLASAVAMNKAFAKQLVRHENILTPDWLLFKESDLARPQIVAENIMTHFNMPVIVKPNNSGSTVGLSLVKDTNELFDAVESAASVTGEVLAEQYIRGREITAAILNGKPLPLVEIIPAGELYDYQCKYTKGKSKYICPAEIPADITSDIQQSAEKIYKIIGCEGLARVDFIMSEQNQAYFLEVNTLPGMTELSLAPMAAKEAGIDFDDLVDHICQSALKE